VIDRSTTRDTPIDPMAPLQGRTVVWNPCRGNHLGQRSYTSASNRPDIWTQRSGQDAAKHLARRRPSTYGSRPTSLPGVGRPCIQQSLSGADHPSIGHAALSVRNARRLRAPGRTRSQWHRVGIIIHLDGPRTVAWTELGRRAGDDDPRKVPFPKLRSALTVIS
jgi:hypothetical protein